MAQTINVQFPSGKIITTAYGTPVFQIIAGTEIDKTSFPVVGAFINNEVVSLSFKVEVNAEIKPVLLNSAIGARIYRRTLCFLLAMAVNKLFPERRLVIGHSLGRSYYYYFEGISGVNQDDLDLIQEEMRRLIQNQIPIERKVLSYTEAVNHFADSRQEQTSLLLNHLNKPKIPIYHCQDFIDLSHGPLVQNTGILQCFELRNYSPGFLLRYPPADSPDKLNPQEENKLLFSIYQNRKQWGKILGVHSVGALNDQIHDRKIKSFIKVAEALQNKKIAEIADDMASRGKDLKVGLIAGPSSSGKTTFTKKLAIQLRVLGYDPVLVSLDDYFLPRSQTPRDKDGNYNFECLEAIDVKLLNEQLLNLLDGKEQIIPIFDFKIGGRKDHGHKMQLNSNSILLMEGIHGLNPGLTEQIDNKNKYKIYVSALTQLNLDDHNRIATTDNRLLRRMVRDHQFRGHSALATLGMWPSVRRGENQNIFPFQDNADSAFNSALDYELSVLKVYAEPLLKTVKPTDELYSEASRLLHFLENLLPLTPRYVPDDSILREFIGESEFKY